MFYLFPSFSSFCCVFCDHRHALCLLSKKFSRHKNDFCLNYACFSMFFTLSETFGWGFDMNSSIECKRKQGEDETRIIISKSREKNCEKYKMKLNRKRVINVHRDMSNELNYCDSRGERVELLKINVDYTSLGLFFCYLLN